MSSAGIFSRGASGGASGGSHPQAQSPGGAQQTKSPAPRAGTPPQLTARTSNYSIAPGPVWLEAVNPAVIAVAAATPVRVALPLQGSGFLWRYTQRPVLVAVLPPQGPPFDQGARFGDEAHEPKPPDYHWWPRYAHRSIADATAAELDPGLPMQELKAAQDALKQKIEEEQKKQQEQQQKEKQQEKQQEQGKQPEPPKAAKPQTLAEEEEQMQMQERQMQSRVAPPPGTVDPWLQSTGMSAQGFPGFPRSLPVTSALPATAGIRSAMVDDTADPPELTVTMVGSGNIPAGSRWLFMTLTGV